MTFEDYIKKVLKNEYVTLYNQRNPFSPPINTHSKGLIQLVHFESPNRVEDHKIFDETSKKLSLSFQPTLTYYLNTWEYKKAILLDTFVTPLLHLLLFPIGKTNTEFEYEKAVDKTLSLNNNIIRTHAQDILDKHNNLKTDSGDIYFMKN